METTTFFNPKASHHCNISLLNFSDSIKKSRVLPYAQHVLLWLIKYISA